MNEKFQIFWAVNSHGNEKWCEPDEFDRKLAASKKREKARRDRRKKDFAKIERTLKRGATRKEDDKIFWGYEVGFRNFENWVTPEQYEKNFNRRKLPKAREQINESKRRRYRQDMAYKMTIACRGRIKSRIRMFVKSGAILRNRAPKYSCGCSKQELLDHIESQFKEGMTWKNHGKWHVDHIKPLAMFDMTDPDEIKKAMHYTNLQPLWAEENWSKGARYIG